MILAARSSSRSLVVCWYVGRCKTYLLTYLPTLILTVVILATVVSVVTVETVVTVVTVVSLVTVMTVVRVLTVVTKRLVSPKNFFLLQEFSFLFQKKILKKNLKKFRNTYL